MPVQSDGSRGRLIEPTEQFYECRFAGSVIADDGDFLPWMDEEIDVIKGILLRARIGKRDVIERDFERFCKVIDIQTLAMVELVLHGDGVPVIAHAGSLGVAAIDRGDEGGNPS